MNIHTGFNLTLNLKRNLKLNLKLNRRLSLLILLLLTVGCAPEQQNQTYDSSDPKLHANVIYGSDGRLDVYQVTDDQLKKLAQSTVALIKTTDLVIGAKDQTIVVGKNFGVDYNLCSSEKFREQDAAAFCSGALVGNDLVLTAGHCIETLADCQSTSLVFDYAVKSIGVLPKQIQTSSIYKCKEIVKTVRNNAGMDFAVIRLEKPVLNRDVLKIRSAGELAIGDELTVIGHPVGLPTKITTGGKVRSISNSEYIVASVDTYGGNSGSAVFNSQSGLIEGILVRGEQDFERQGNCSVSKVCTDAGCRGEDITRISVARPYIPNSGSINPQPTPILKPELFSALVNRSIPDNNTQGILSTLQATSTPQGRKVLITVDVTHPYIGDLSLQVLAPDGKSVLIHSRAGGRTVDLKKSYDVTSTLGSISTAGNYKLVVKDLAAQDVGILKSWSIQFK